MKTRTLREIGEAGLIRWIANRRADRGRGIILGIGDDAAALTFAPNVTVLASADAVVEGIHFSRQYYTPEQIGRKAVAVNLSDMAAMGGTGRYLLCQAGLPAELDPGFLRRCLGSLMAYARRKGVRLVGGDITGTGGPFFLAVTILGEAPGGRLLTRSGARPGDMLVVSGCPGLSATGLAMLQAGFHHTNIKFRHIIKKHLEPEPRLALSRLAVASGAVTAAIDLSDGIAVDLGHLCESSGLGAEVYSRALPGSPLLDEAASLLGLDPLETRLHGGEDYELLLAVKPEQLDHFVRAARAARHRLTVIGRFLKGSPRARLLTDKGRRPLLPQGFNHFAPRQAKQRAK